MKNEKQTFNKSGFEIRETVLAMAKDYMDQAWNMNMEFTKTLFEAGKKTAEDMEQAMKPYSIEAMLEKANEMYRFVTKKD